MPEERSHRVLHLITRLDPGGSAENTVLSAERVAPGKYSSVVWTGPGLEGNGPPEEYRRRLAGKYNVVPHLVRPIRPVSDMQAVYTLAKRLARAKPDILHLHSAKAGAVGRVAARLSGRRMKIVYTPHGHVFSGYGGREASALFTTVEKALAPWCHAIVGLTGDEICAFHKAGAGRPEQFCVIPSGVELEPYLQNSTTATEVRDELGIGQNVQIVGFVGRFEPVKGPDLFLETAGAIRRANSEVEFLMVGDGSMRAGLHRQAEALGIAGALHWTGWRNDIPRLLRAMNLFLLTSRNEGQGRVMVEAMASELPVVAMRSGGVAEVVEDGKTGVVVEGESVDSAAEAVAGLLDDPGRCRALGRAGRDRAKEHFSVDVMLARLEQLYDGLLAGRTPAGIFPAG